ncbi:WYL domain-containing protein [bacterium]|nr:WYL domain-containing protein [bacterium]
MSATQIAKKNISGMQVIKTLQLLLEDNYTMKELIDKLNANEEKSVFNNSVVSKYINTCRYCGIEILKIHNKYFVSNLPFGLKFSIEEIRLIEQLQKLALDKLTNKSLLLFNNFINKLNKYSNKDIVNVHKKTKEMVYELFNKALLERRKVCLMLKTKASLECIPVDIVNQQEKTFFKVLYKGKYRNLSVSRVSGLEILGKSFSLVKTSGQRIEYKLTGGLAKRYTLREHEELLRTGIDCIYIACDGENKEELLSRLLRYDKDCEIIKPQSYRDEMRKMLNNMLANYGE